MTLEGFWFEYGGWMLTYALLLACAVALMWTEGRKKP